MSTVETTDQRFEWTFADRLRKARRVAGLSQDDLAQKLNVAPGTIAGWEAGNTKPRQLVDTTLSIAAATGAPVGWLLGLEDDPTSRRKCDYCGELTAFCSCLGGPQIIDEDGVGPAGPALDGVLTMPPVDGLEMAGPSALVGSFT